MTQPTIFILDDYQLCYWKQHIFLRISWVPMPWLFPSAHRQEPGQCPCRKRGVLVYVTLIPTQWASYQIRKIAGCACAGNAGNVSPRRRLQRKTLVSDSVMHVGIAYPLRRGKHFRHSRRMRTRNSTYLARGPLDHTFRTLTEVIQQHRCLWDQYQRVCNVAELNAFHKADNYNTNSGQ